MSDPTTPYYGLTKPTVGADPDSWGGLLNGNFDTIDAAIYAAAAAGFRNRIINGGMAVDQRNNGAAHTVSTSGGYTLDRWTAITTGANATGQRVAGSGSSRYRYQITGAAGVTSILLAQRIETANSYDLNGTTVTLSAELANTLLTTVTWAAYYANADDNFGSKTQIATGTFTVNGSIAKYSTQINIPSAAVHGIEINFSVGAQTSGTWTIGAVQLEPGNIATPFERRGMPIELMLCRRYYAAGTSQALAQGTGTYVGGQTQFTTPMRIAPAMTYSALDSTANSVTVAPGSVTTVPSSGSPVASVTTERFFTDILVTVSGVKWCRFNWTADAEL